MPKFNNSSNWLENICADGIGGADPEPPDPEGANPPPAASPRDAATDSAAAVAFARKLGVQRAIETATGQDGKPRAWQDVDTIAELLDQSKISIDFGTGEITGLTEQLDNLATTKPFLLKGVEQQQQPTIPGGYGTTPNGGNSGNHPAVPQTADDYLRQSPGVYGGVLERLAGAQPN